MLKTAPPCLCFLCVCICAYGCAEILVPNRNTKEYGQEVFSRQKKMALPMLRGCSRLPSTLSFTRLFFNESPVLNRSGRTRLSPCSAAAVAVSVRPYSSEQGKHIQRVKLIDIQNPINWLRIRFYYFLIRGFLDQEFNIDDFSEGAKQAFSHVSRLLSQCQFDALEGLVAKDIIGKLEEKCSSLPSDLKKALCVDPDEIIHAMPRDVGIYYDDNERRFVSILMRFWYLKSVQLPESGEENPTFKMATGDGEEEPQTKTLLTAIYEFQREFTKGVPPEWTITRIEHSKLFD